MCSAARMRDHRCYAWLVVCAFWPLDPVVVVRAQPVPNGAEFQVNTYTTGDQGFPALARDSNGDFVVVWRSSVLTASSIRGQGFRADGSHGGGESQVNTYTNGGSGQPDVASTGAGGFIATWMSSLSSGGDTSDASIQAQRYDASGAVGGRFS